MSITGIVVLVIIAFVLGCIAGFMGACNWIDKGSS